MKTEARSAWGTALALGLAITIATAWPGRAFAGSAVSWLGSDARTSGMGGAGAALGKGGFMLLVNPALMTAAPSGLWMSFTAAPNGLQIDPEERSGDYDVSTTIYDSQGSSWRLENGQSYLDRPVPTAMLGHARNTTEPASTFLLGISAVEDLFIEELRLGLSFVTPLPSALTFRTWYNDEREQHFSNQLHFERFGEFDEVVTITPGIAWRPVDWFAVGFALDLDFGITLDTQLFMPDGLTWDYAYVVAHGDVVLVPRPIAGLYFQAPAGFSFGLVYREESYTDVDVEVALRIWNGDTIDPVTGQPKSYYVQEHNLVLGYRPREVKLGAAWTEGPFSVEVDGAWQQWSKYLDHHGNNWTHPTTDPDDDTTEEGWDDDWQDPTFDDVFTVQGGVEYRFGELAAVRAGAGWFPTPVPEQTGRYNYVDNDLILYSIGGGVAFELGGYDVSADLAAQLWQMKELTVRKDSPSERTKEDGGFIDEVPDTVEGPTGEPLEEARNFQSNNPGLPGYTLGGFMGSITLTLGVAFN